MAVVFRGAQTAEISALFQKSYSLDSGVVYVPVRHHSPACSFHVQNTIERYNPEVILIEGPSDCNHLIPHIVSEKSEAPLCIYCSYDDQSDVLERGESGKYRAYYPLLDYSPELVALREGAARSIPTFFIDLPYKEYLFAAREKDKARLDLDEHYFRQSEYVRSLCERTGCRSFHEFWEKYFELQGFHMESDEFISQLLAYCYYTRADYTADMLEEDGCAARELYMAKEIEKARKTYSKVLVITGGFHVKGLIELEGESKHIQKSPLSSAYAKVYAMPYSFKESGRAGGYASGMPAPAFYQHIWETKDGRAAKRFVMQLARQLKGEGVSTADEIEAVRMIRELATLRGKMEPGLYELTDSVRSAFVKGELSSASKPLDLLSEQLQGRKRGKLTHEADVPPLVQDFRALARSFRLPIRSTIPQDVILDTYKKERHKRLSQWFHQLAFLDVPFCEKLKGPNPVRREHVHLMRETWRYRFSAQVESALIELSVYGGTVEEAAQEALRARLHQAQGHAGELALLLAEACWSGLFSDFTMYASIMDEAIGADRDFVSMTDCAYYLSRIEGADAWAERTRNKALSLFSMLDGGEPGVVAEKLIHLFMLDTGDVQLVDALEQYMQKESRSSEIEGAVLGLLAVLQKRTEADVMCIAEGYFYGSGSMQKEAAPFLAGLLASAKDMFLYSEPLLTGLSHVFDTLDEEAFLHMLPHLRLLFGQLTPLEINRIARQVAALYDTTKDDVRKEAIAEDVLAYAIHLDRTVRAMLKERGLDDEEQ